MSLAEKIFGTFSDRELKKINPITKKVLALEPKYQALSDADLQAQTPALKARLAGNEPLNPYAVLGVPQNATPEQIRKARADRYYAIGRLG